MAEAGIGLDAARNQESLPEGTCWVLPGSAIVLQRAAKQRLPRSTRPGAWVARTRPPLHWRYRFIPQGPGRERNCTS